MAVAFIALGNLGGDRWKFRPGVRFRVQNDLFALPDAHRRGIVGAHGFQAMQHQTQEPAISRLMPEKRRGVPELTDLRAYLHHMPRGLDREPSVDPMHFYTSYYMSVGDVIDGTSMKREIYS